MYWRKSWPGSCAMRVMKLSSARLVCAADPCRDRWSLPSRAAAGSAEREHPSCPGPGDTRQPGSLPAADRDRQSVGSAGNGPRHVFAIIVDDVDAVCAELTGKGVTLLNGPEDRAWGMRTASFQDPDGYVWEIATPVAQAEG